MPTSDPLDARAIRDGLGTFVVGTEVSCFDTCDSTNQRAWDAARAGSPDGAAFLADTQTAGRGRRGRSWLDQPGDCLLLSVLLRPATLPAAEAQLLTMLAASATAAAVATATGLGVELKWPNDVVAASTAGDTTDERKLAGILVETSFLGETLDAAVVGIGLNVNLDVGAWPEIAATATSLARELGRPIYRVALARELLRQLDRRYDALRRGDGAGIFAEWRRRLGTIGRRVEVLDAEGIRRVVEAEDVAPDGALIGRLDDETRVVYHFGEVSLRTSDYRLSDVSS